ncbi:ankyrin repeat-containing domain protein [Flagelloscypha sp. PMI_526]|nr:ankyrin repeat-containing domain protein [Flagelloscypha sp. PMI_526]
MTDQRASAREHEGITALALDGTPNLLDALSELYILQEAAGRWAFRKGLDLRGDEVRPTDMFDIIGGTGIGGVIVLTTTKAFMPSFFSDPWNNKAQQACVDTLKATLDEIIEAFEIETSLDSPFEEKNAQTKCFVCTVNPVAASSCRLLRNYRPRTDQSPRCTIRQVLHATLSNHDQIPAVYIEEERFISALNGYANPTHVLVKELGNVKARGTLVACLANIGAGEVGIQSLTSQGNSEELAGLLRSCQLVADDVAGQCHDLGPFFFRFSVSSGLGHECHFIDNEVSRVKGLTMAYLSTDEVSARLDDLEDKLRERFGVVSVERLNSVAGKGGESRVAARLAKVEEHLNDTIFQVVNHWLLPIHQTSKLDVNIRARSGTTCRWLLENDTYIQWMHKQRGLFWFRGLMGTGKTVLSSFVIETLLARDDIYIAYYYFEFTNPTTLSEEALLRSLVCQLASASPAVVRAFHQKHNNGGLQPQLITLQNTLNELVSASTKPVFIIIDALDELPLAQRKYLLQSLLTFSASNDASLTRIMVTSREEVDIHRAFEEKVDFELAVHGDLVRQDIAAFVDRELQTKKWKFWSEDAIDMARRLLNEKADGQFRMVACQVDILQQVKTYEQLRQALHSLPNTLSETYNYILANIPKHLRDQAHRLFAILSVVPESISVHELSALLAVDFGDEEDSDQLPEFHEMNWIVDPLDVADLGTSLVSRVGSYRGTFLQLAHASVKEHLLAPSEAWFSLCEDLAHGMIARSCLALLVHFQILQQKDKVEGLFRYWPESKVGTPYRYSTTNWFNHVLPNGPPQLLRQQQRIYESFPWPCIDERNRSPYKWTTSPLASAASFGLFDLVETLSNAPSLEANLADALVAAASSNRAESISIQCCRILIASGADVDAFGVNPFASHYNITCPLHVAAFEGKLEMVRFLIEKGADVNVGGRVYGTALQAAAFMGNLNIVRFLVEKGADVNPSGDKYGTALQAAISSGSLEVIHFLLENGADVDADGGSALQASAYRGNIEIVDFLLERGADLNAGGGSALQASAYLGKMEVARFLVGKGADVNASGGEYGSALQAGSYSGELEIVRFLIEKGADVNASGGKYGSALQTGSYHGGLETVRFLVENGADVNASGGKYGSALSAGAYSADLEIIRFLVRKGADVNASGGKYGSALQAGAYHGGLETVRFLVENGADVNAGGGEYGSALQAGAYRTDLQIVRFLVNNGADVNTGGGQYGSALQAGAYRAGSEIVRFLVDHEADVNAIGGCYGSALQAAASIGALDIVQILVEKGADVSVSGGLYGSPLQAGAYGGRLEIVSLLVEKGADVNAVGGMYGTALQAAAYFHYREIAQFLVGKGADVNIVGGRYKTALDAARDQDHGWGSPENPEIAQFLKLCGAKTWEEMSGIVADNAAMDESEENE